MCADAHLPRNEHSSLVGSSRTTSVRLVRNQAHAGHSVVVQNAHATDMSGLPPAQLAAFWAGRSADGPGS